MSLHRLSNKERQLYRVAMAIWIISAALMLLLLNNIDLLVNVKLYDFGLQLSSEWSYPYWSYISLSYAVLFLSLGLSLFAVLVGFIKKNDKIPQSITKPQPKPQSRVCRKEKPREDKNKTPNQIDTKPFSCPSCKKLFSRPLLMLHFENGKNRLVELCPYCSYVLRSEVKNLPRKATYKS